MPDRLWLTISEATERTDYHVDYVRRIARGAHNKESPYQNIIVDKTPQGTWLIWWPSLLEYMESQQSVTDD